jgi:hypothetical protein
MRVAVFTTFAADKREPLADMAGRVHAAFIAAGLAATVRFVFADPPPMKIAAAEKASSIERALRRFPELARFRRSSTVDPRAEAAGRFLINVRADSSTETVDFALIRDILAGVPRSLPFHSVSVNFCAPDFSEGPELPPTPDARTMSMLMRAGVDVGGGLIAAGVTIRDFWQANGRARTIGAMRVVEADPGAKAMPAPPSAVASVYAACGKARKTTQIPLVIGAAPQASADAPSPAPALSPRLAAIGAVVRNYRALIGALASKAPHDLPHAIPPESAADASGPKKPALVAAFSPLGYTVRGETGAFLLRRRTPDHLTVEVNLDVGTWSQALSAFMRVYGLADGVAFKAQLPLPASPGAARGVVHGAETFAQFPIGGPERWAKIVENLAALVAELDRTFLPELESVAGPSPEWHEPR